MQAKQLAFEQLMDIRAARILVNSVADCYAALGVVHSLWQFIPGEFDDYIATPKDNFYRSIHTAVIGPGGEPIEIQIRTHEMHANSERGVAAHWRYKEGGRGDMAYERKINQLRSLLTPVEGSDTERDFLDRVRIDLFQDRVYVLSPKGEVVDVPIGGTPLDFAYQVHTDLGHRTRGAKVNGRMVGLDYRLKNSDTVEIIAAKSPQPSAIGYPRSPASSRVRDIAIRFEHGSASRTRRRTSPPGVRSGIGKFSGWASIVRRYRNC
jgi:GTP pyrophosphokinase